MVVEILEKLDCPNCGAPLPIEQGMAVIICKYCSSAISMNARAKYFLSHSMIPSKIDEKEVRERIISWMGGGYYKPENLARKASISRLECTYMPFFVLETKAKMSYTGRLTRTGAAVDKSGSIDKDLLWKVLARRESKFPTMEYKIPIETKIAFSLADMVNGATFLNAEMDEREATDIAKEQIRSHMLQLIESEIDEVRSSALDCNVENIEFVHAPIWRAVYEYRGSYYKMYLDGSSGDVIRAEVPPQDVSLLGLIRLASAE